MSLHPPQLLSLETMPPSKSIDAAGQLREHPASLRLTVAVYLPEVDPLAAAAAVLTAVENVRVAE